MYTKKQFKCDLEKLISICEKELKNRKYGINGDGTIQQIENVILPELYDWIKKVETNNMPPKNERWFACAAHVLQWGLDWNMKNPSEMMLMIGEVDTKFCNLEP
ncbi:MAG: hypothetical protein FWE22_06685 [Firmicutes bacterium]|nr:hypothetical protein [Bacillota bacterium]